MSMEKLAHLLGVDEVEAEHGSLGVAMSVRIGKSWLATRLDEDDLGHGHARQRVLAKGLTELTDLLRIKMGRTATRKAGLDVPYPLPAYDSYQPQRAPYQQPPTFQAPAPRPAVVEQPPEVRMGSRFEAIVAEIAKERL